MTMELEPLTGGALSLVTGEFTVDDVAEKLASPLPEPDPDAKVAFPDLPVPVGLTPTQRADLDSLPGMFGVIHMRERRALTDHELTTISAEALLIESVAAVLKKRAEEIKEMARVHMDVDAEKNGLAFAEAQTGKTGEVLVPATPRDQHGHYLRAQPEQPYSIPTQGYSQGFQQRYIKGGVDVSADALDDLFAAGAIDRDTYLACTREVRRLDLDKLKAFIRKQPAVGLRVLRTITKRGTPKASLYPPKL